MKKARNQVEITNFLCEDCTATTRDTPIRGAKSIGTGSNLVINCDRPHEVLGRVLGMVHDRNAFFQMSTTGEVATRFRTRQRRQETLRQANIECIVLQVYSGTKTPQA